MANPEHLNILKQGVTVWNDWREANPEVKPDLQGADLSGVNLIMANLSKANLSKANLYKAYLSEADLSEANLFRANLSEAILIKATLFNAVLSNAIVSGAFLTDAKLLLTKLSGADLTKASLTGQNLFVVDLSGANLSSADLSKANLAKVDLIGANLSSANLSKANLVKVDLFGANLNKTNLSEAKLKYTDFQGANLAYTDFSGATFKHVWVSSQSEFEMLNTPPTLNQIKGTIFLDQAVSMAQKPYAELSERALRSRRNLLALAVMCMLSLMVRVKEVNAMGWLHVEGLTNSLIIALLFAVTVYFLVQFAFQALASKSGWDLSQEHIAVPDRKSSDTRYSRSVLEDFSIKFEANRAQARRRFWGLDVGLPCLLGGLGILCILIRWLIQLWPTMHM